MKRLILITLLCAFMALPAMASSLPKGFVYLRDIDPTIIQDMRYATPDNFTGAPVPGYEEGECVLTRRTAQQLARVQELVRHFGLSLKVFDCYRPKEAVQHFIDWVNAKPSARGPYHPNISRAQLLQRGYIARQSTHSKGIAVDVTIGIPVSGMMIPIYAKNNPCNFPLPKDASGTEADMGTGFDCFDPRSHTKSPQNTLEQQQNRATLLSVMKKHGFKNYKKEWWHFTLAQ